MGGNTKLHLTNLLEYISNELYKQVESLVGVTKCPSGKDQNKYIRIDKANRKEMREMDKANFNKAINDTLAAEQLEFTSSFIIPSSGQVEIYNNSERLSVLNSFWQDIYFSKSSNKGILPPVSKHQECQV